MIVAGIFSFSGSSESWLHRLLQSRGFKLFTVFKGKVNKKEALTTSFKYNMVKHYTLPKVYSCSIVGVLLPPAGSSVIPKACAPW